MSTIDRDQEPNTCTMEQSALVGLEYESLQAEKRDRLNARIQHWSLFFALVSGFGLVSVQSGSISYLVALYPFLATCLARYVAHSEQVLDQVKAYLLIFEQRHNYVGYEQYNALHKKHRAAGSQIKALRDAIATTQVLAAFMSVVRLLDHLPLTIGIIVVELVVATISWRLLSKKQEECGPRQERASDLDGGLVVEAASGMSNGTHQGMYSGSQIQGHDKSQSAFPWPSTFLSERLPFATLISRMTGNRWRLPQKRE